MKIKFQGKPVTLDGQQLQMGDSLPDFELIKSDLSNFTTQDTSGVRIFLTVPSLDTPVCDLEVLTFSKLIKDIPNVTCYVVSMDLPFAQSRWCGAKGIDNIVTVSDYKTRTFALASGTMIKEVGLLTRAAFVVDKDDLIVHVEYVEEVTQQPNFDEIIKFAKALA
ncbi:MAG: thiol peroxidase [Firmicutes bacterium]|nr:thiol peroxidase [Bacillota bacterium]MCL1954087.1 thiol peroxidase [Bacillota bacterium]